MPTAAANSGIVSAILVNEIDRLDSTGLHQGRVHDTETPYPPSSQNAYSMCLVIAAARP
jgi:hypothetical protein